ncbi:sensor histidine kinase [Promicromonospora sp. NPDC059942]|uniref:sensor histidine kinase n=1 Tax=Promicromonospora sp. NPDC059942 TaxID=3347009 RepID=UPI003652B8EF
MSTATGRALDGLSVRWRLTVTYTVVAVVSAAVLLAAVYLLVELAQPDTVVLKGEPAELPLMRPGDELALREALDEQRADAVDTTLRSFLVWSAVGLALMAGVSVAVGWAFAGRALRPVHTITSRARRLSADSLDQRLHLDGPRDELREMAETFDSLLDRIQAAFASERRLVATMSHELRTPLANQRAVLEVALADPGADAATLRHAAEVARGQAERAQRTVDALLTLARVQAGAETSRLAPVALEQITGAAVDATRDLEGAAELSWQVSLDPATVTGDADLLALAVGNLLHNAVLHNVEGGWVRVRVAASVGSAVVEVANSGPELDPGSVEALTLPFRRGGRDRTSSTRGTGLGLTIVSAVAEHHHADLRLRARDDGGLDARLALPLAP